MGYSWLAIQFVGTRNSHQATIVAGDAAGTEALDIKDDRFDTRLEVGMSHRDDLLQPHRQRR